MIYFNNNFSNPSMKVLNEKIFSHLNIIPAANVLENRISVNDTLATDSTVLKTINQVIPAEEKIFNTNKVENVFMVTQEYIKALDQLYVKMWNESVTEDSFYIKENLISIFKNFNSTYSQDTFKALIDRMIDNGFMEEKYRLSELDCIVIPGMVKTTFTKVVDDATQVMAMEYNLPVKMNDLVLRTNGEYLENKEMYLMMTPYLNNDNSYVPFTWSGKTDVVNQYSLFKAKENNTKYGTSIPMATHLFYKFASPEEREIYTLEGKSAPDLVYDHTDKISHFDQLKFTIKFSGVAVQGQ